MLNKINKLIHASKDESNEVKQSLASILEKVKDKALGGRTYLLIDIKEMESLVSPDKVDAKDNVGKVELDL